MPDNLKILPRLKESISFIYLEKCVIKEDAFSIIKVDKEGKTPIPVATVTVLMLGPGAAITHRAVQNVCDCGCSIVWCGEGGMRFYASGKGETENGKNALKQAKLCMDPSKHTEVVKQMYKIRFPDILKGDFSVEQLRGMEGVRMRTLYKALSKRTGIPWKGRAYDLDDWNKMDDINKAISSANQYLYGVCYSAVISLGFSPALGFVHTGRSESFVYDIADLYKAETTIPAAFEAVATGSKGEVLERTIRRKCRAYFSSSKLMSRIPNDILSLMSLADDDDLNPATSLWDYKRDVIEGGKNYGCNNDG